MSLCALKVRYPLPYRDAIVREAELNGISGELVAAVVWTESKFDSDAVSGKGARGLMQLMPRTAEWCAELKGVEYSDDMLFDPEYNIALGAFYLKYLIDKFGDETAAVAAYNAGEGNVSKWGEISPENIPFPETAEYVKRVARARNVYKAFIKQT